MKKFSTLILIIVLALTMGNLAHAQPETVNQKDFESLSLTLLNPSISQAISQYYQKIQKPVPSHGLYDIKVLELKRSLPGGYAYRVVLEVNTYYGAHNPPNAKETIIFNVDPVKVTLVNFDHENLKP